MFNLNTYAALDDNLDRHSQNQLIWLPDAARLRLLPDRELARGRRRPPVPGRRRLGSPQAAGIAWLNLLGSVFFGFSAVASVVLKTGEQLNVDVATWMTFAGAVCFFGRPTCWCRAASAADVHALDGAAVSGAPGCRRGRSRPRAGR